MAVLPNAKAPFARWRISYRDGAVVETASAAGCSILRTEDLQDGTDFAGVRVVNPFG